MGSKVIFSRAPQGTATQAPPPIGPASSLGASERAAREDHTHEGVHRIAVGDGLSLSPASGLGDVTLAVRHWRPPVQQATELPRTGNEPGDARVVLAEASIYVWTGAAWQKVTSAGSDGGGGGGGGPGFDAWGALNRLRLGLEHVKATNRPALTAYSERYDALADDSGIDWSRSSNVELRDGRIVARPSQWVGFGDDFVQVPVVQDVSRQVTVSLLPGAFEYGVTDTLGAWGTADVPAPVATPQTGGTRELRWTERLVGAPKVVPLSPGGFDYGTSNIVAGTMPVGRFEAGVTSVLTASREVVQFATGPATEVQAADGTFEAGVTAVIQRPIRRGGVPTAVTARLDIPAVPGWAYAVVQGERIRLYVSRDDGVTWAPIGTGGTVALDALPAGTWLRLKVELDDEVRSYVDGMAYGAAP